MTDSIQTPAQAQQPALLTDELIEKIPRELRERDKWVLWKLVPDKDTGKPRKIPCTITGQTAAVDNPATWASFAAVRERYRRGGFAGVGYVFSADDPYCGVDLDACRCAATGEIALWASAVLHELNSYSEVSQSGEGVKVIVRAKSPLAKGRRTNVDAPQIASKPPMFELYDHRRFFALTGNRLPNMSPNIEDRQAEVEAVAKRFFPERQPASAPAPRSTSYGHNGNGQAGGRWNAVERYRAYLNEFPVAVSGERGHDRLYAAVCRGVIDFDLSAEAVWGPLKEWNESCVPPWDDDDLRRKIDEVLKNEAGPRGRLLNADHEEWHRSYADAPCKANATRRVLLTSGDDKAIPSITTDDGRTEMANAKRFAARFGKDVRWIDLWDKWLRWDNKRWAVDQVRMVEAKAKEVAVDLWSEFTEIAKQNPKSVAPIAAFCKASNSARGINGMLALTRSEEGIAILPDRFDTNPWLFNVANGTIDLKTGELHPHRRDDWLTKLAPVEYLPAYEAECPTWERFLREVFADNDSLIQFIQRFAGYTLTGLTNERCFAFLFGSGRNGKTTLETTLQKLMGDYATGITAEMLMVKKSGIHPTEICDLAGCRMAVATETEEGRRFAESFLKQMTGGEDRLKGRRVFENFWEFQPSHKLWISGNHRPAIRGTDPAVWDRVRLVPFDVRFDQPDKELPKKLEVELPGILRWAVQGCLEWQRHGLGEPDEVRTATAQYRSYMDVVGAFIADVCFVGDHVHVRSSSLYAEYSQWCRRTNEHQFSQRRFGEVLSERGFERYSSNGICYRGIGLRHATADVNGGMEP